MDILIFARLLADLPPRAFQGILGARCLALFAQSFDLRLATGAAEFRHRRSRRHPALASALLRFPKPEVSGSSCHAQVPGRDRVPLPISPAAGWGLSPFRYIPVRPGFLACPVSLRRALLKRARLHLAEASSKQSLDERVDMFHRHPWEINHWNVMALRLYVPVDLCPEDKLKVRLRRPSGNIRTREFSTSGDFACGRAWISQRFVAIVMK
ncbi:MAG: hypothetical protein NWS68_04765 [Erythrobacter sp.]|nr:hypothetical protein [Erythrobacter sp.]